MPIRERRFTYCRSTHVADAQGVHAVISPDPCYATWLRPHWQGNLQGDGLVEAFLL